MALFQYSVFLFGVLAQKKILKNHWPSTTGMVWHRGTLTWLAAVLALCGSIQLTHCAACVVTFGDVALPGSSVF